MIHQPCTREWLSETISKIEDLERHLECIEEFATDREHEAFMSMKRRAVKRLHELEVGLAVEWRMRG